MTQAEITTGSDVRIRSRVERPRGAAWALIAIVVLYALLLLGGPLAAIVWGAAASGVKAMARELSSFEALNALRLTMILSLSATLLNTVFGLILAIVLARDEFRGRRIVNGVIDLPFAVSPVIAGFMLMLLFGRNGWFTGALDALNLRVVFALPGMLLATVFVSLPFVVRETLPVLRHLGSDQEKVAYTMGAGYWRTFFQITLPNIRWGLLYGMLLTFARALGEFGAVLVVGGGVTRLTETSTLFIYRSLDDRNEAGAYAMALALAATSFVMLLISDYARKHSQE
jgi:sulfate transport system permease protein